MINILVEEALYKRGVFNIKTGKVLNYACKIRHINENKIKNKKDVKDLSYEFNNNIQNKEDQYIKEASDEFIDQEIYTKFLMFLQFQERMKKGNK